MPGFAAGEWDGDGFEAVGLPGDGFEDGAGFEAVGLPDEGFEDGAGLDAIGLSGAGFEDGMGLDATGLPGVGFEAMVGEVSGDFIGPFLMAACDTSVINTATAVKTAYTIILI